MSRIMSGLWCLAVLSRLLNTGSLNAQLPVTACGAPTAIRARAPRARQVSKAEQEVRNLERAWLDAYEKRDVEAMASIVADDFAITFPDGATQSKAQLIEGLKRPHNPATPSPKFYTEDVQARTYGDIVILTGRVVTEYQRDGETIREQSRYTDTYVKRRGRWQVVASHLSNVAQPQQRGAKSPVGVNDPLVLSNVTVIDGNGGRPKPGMTLVISGGRIADMFVAGRKRLPPGATVMSLKGHYVIPGLIDSHYHFMLGLRSKETEEALHRFAFLGGITAVRDMAGDAIALSELARMAANGVVQCPRVYFSALMGGPTLIQGDRRVEQISHGRPLGEAPWARAITPQTDLTSAVSDAKTTGATGIKIYSDLSPDLVAKLTAEAHRQGLKVWSHAAVYPGKPNDAVMAGVDVISHSGLLVAEGMDKVPERYAGSYSLLDYNGVSYVAPAISALLQLIQKKRVFLDPSLVVTERLAQTEKGRIFQDPRQMAEWTYMVTMRAHILKIPIVVGTDVQENPSTSEFPNIHTEMELLVTKVGLSPLEAITAATRNGAQVLGILDSYGTIARGKTADLIVLSADPSADIRNTTKIVYVIKDGRLHKREKTILPAT